MVPVTGSHTVTPKQHQSGLQVLLDYRHTSTTPAAFALTRMLPLPRFSVPIHPTATSTGSLLLHVTLQLLLHPYNMLLLLLLL